jgi:Tol biopolymer transport system component
MARRSVPSRALAVTAGLGVVVNLGVGGAVALWRAPVWGGPPATEVRAGGSATSVGAPLPETRLDVGPDTLGPPAMNRDPAVGAPPTAVPKALPTLPPPLTTSTTLGPVTTTSVPDALVPGLYVMRPDGSDVVRVATGTRVFSWSPDGRSIAVDQGGTLRVVAADGSTGRTLTAAGTGIYSPVWSSDGSQIAFGRGGDGLFVIPADGSGAATLVDAHAAYQSWTPDGRLSAIRNSTALVVYERDGTSRILATDAWGSVPPAWSPDGRRVAYMSNRIMMVAVDGSGARPLTEPCCGSEWVGSPLAWSPDGQRIAFIDGADVHAVAVDTGEVTTLVPKATTPTWSSDGLRLAFLDYSVTRPDNLLNGEVGVADADGGNRRIVMTLPPTLAAFLVARSGSADRIAVGLSSRTALRVP